MDFYREKLIKKPKKEYRCELCGKLITGEHMYVSARIEDFFTYRAHTECYEKAQEMCSKCTDSGYCQSSNSECFSEKINMESK